MKEYNEQVVETLDDAGCIIANKNIIIDNLQARIAELEAENARLKAAVEYAETIRVENIAYFEKQLAAEQLNNKRLRGALEAVIKVHGYESGIPVEAFAQPSDTSALDAYVAEKVKDVQLQDIEQYLLQMAGISTAAIGYWKEGDSILPAYDTPALRDVAKLYANYESRTRQRDLAVEALHYCVKQVPELATVPGIATAIKESEAK